MIEKITNSEGNIELHLHAKSHDEIKEEVLASNPSLAFDGKALRLEINHEYDKANKDVLDFLSQITMFWKNRVMGDPIYGYFDKNNRYVDEIIIFDEETRVKLSTGIISRGLSFYFSGTSGHIQQKQYLSFNVFTAKKKKDGELVDVGIMKGVIVGRVKSVCNEYYNIHSSDMSPELESHCYTGLYIGRSIRKIINSLMPDDHELFITHRKDFKGKTSEQVSQMLINEFFSVKNIYACIEEMISSGKIGNGIRDLVDVDIIEVQTSSTPDFVKKISVKRDASEIFDDDKADSPRNRKPAYLSRIDVIVPIEPHFRDTYPDKVTEMINKNIGLISKFVRTSIYRDSDFKSTYNDLSLFKNTFVGFNGSELKFTFELKEVA